MTSILDKKATKAIISGATALLIDKMYYKSTNLKSSISVAAIVAGASYISSIISPKMEISKYQNSTFDAGTLQERITELGIAFSGSYAANKYMDTLKSDFSLKDSLILFALSSLAGEYGSDYLFKQPLSYLV